MRGRRRRGTDRQQRDLWPWLSLLPFGLGAWAPVVAGVRRRVWWWIVLGLVWTAIAVVAFVEASQPHQSHRHRSLVGGLVLLAWIGGAVTSFAIRRSYDRRGAGRVQRPAQAWPEPTERSRQWTVRYALLAYVATFLGPNALALILRYGFGVHIVVGVGVLLIDACLLAGLVPLRRRLGMSPQDLGLRLTRGPRSIGLVALALVAYGVFTGVWAVAFASHSTAKTLSGNPTHASTLNVVLAVIALSVSAPFVEEVFFRGLLYRSLRNRLAVIPAALLAGCLFGLVHITSYPLITLPVKAAFGVIACLLYERTRSLWPGIALHAFVDASLVDVALTGNNVIVLIVSAAIAVLVVLATMLRRARTRRRSREAPADSQPASPWV